MFSIVIPTSGKRGTLSLCLASCLSQVVDQFTFEVIVVANPPSKEVEEHVARLAREKDARSIDSHDVRVRYLESIPVGVNRARNLGAALASGTYLVFLDDDCILPTSDWLNRLADQWKSTPAVAAIGSGYSDACDANWLERGSNLVANSWAGDNGPGVRLLGGNTSYRRDVLFRHKGFNDSILSGGDEFELNVRLQCSSEVLRWVDDLTVVHLNQTTLQKAVTRAWSHGLAAARFELDSLKGIRKHSSERLKQWRRSLRRDKILALFLLIHYFAFATARLAGAANSALRSKFRIKSEEYVHG